MELPKIKMPQIGGLDGLKEKLGIGGSDGDGFEDERVDDFGDYDGTDGDYVDYRDGYANDTAFDDGFGIDYVAPAPISASSSSRVKPADIGSGSGYSAYPKLISFEDVRSHTAASEEARREAAAREAAAREERAARDAGQSHDSYTADAQTGAGLEGAVAQGGRASWGQGYEPAPAAEPAAVKEFAMPRMVVVMRPFKYDEVEAVAEALKKGDAVVLDLAATPHELVPRILDFSFGAASMVDATVDCLAAKVFSIQAGEPLSREEFDRLRSQGVLGR